MIFESKFREPNVTLKSSQLLFKSGKMICYRENRRYFFLQILDVIFPSNYSLDFWKKVNHHMRLIRKDFCSEFRGKNNTLFRDQQ